MFVRASLIVGLLVVGSTAHASFLSYDISISSDELTGSLEPVFDRVSVTDPNGPIGNTLSLRAGQNRGTASAVADFGRLQLVSEIVIDPGDEDGNFDAVQAIASWGEFITIHAPGLAGSPGTFRAQVRVSGSLDAGSLAVMDLSTASWVITGTFGQLGFGRCEAALSGPPGCTLSGLSLPVTLTTPERAFMFGSPFQVVLQAITFGRTSFGGFGIADLSQSVEWIGFAEVRDQAQVPVTDFSVTSESGFDYGAALDADGDGIPDPGLQPCKTGETSGCADNCPFEPNNGGEDVQRDSDDNGRGDACECGNADKNARVDIFDALHIAQGTLQPPLVEMIHPRACDADGNGKCDIFDALRVAQGTLVPPLAEIVQECEAATTPPGP